MRLHQSGDLFQIFAQKHQQIKQKIQFSVAEMEFQLPISY